MRIDWTQPIVMECLDPRPEEVPVGCQHWELRSECSDEEHDRFTYCLALWPGPYRV